MHNTPQIAIVGAGFGGLCMAIELQRAGIDSFTIFDKGSDIGGIWRDNVYPGCSCDVPSHLYSYSFEPYRDTARRYPDQADILNYLHDIANKYRLHPHLRLGSEITAAHYHEHTGRWTLTVNGTETYVVDIVIYAVGQLHRPYLPDILGRSDFAGASFHSARWDTGHNLNGQRIAVIGTGSSAAQLIPSIAQQAQQLLVFQRTPTWVLPKPRATFSVPVQHALQRISGLHSLYRACLQVIGDAIFWPAITRGWSAKPLEWAARSYLRTQIQDATLRRALTPNHPIGCKRVILGNNYYSTLTQDHVQLITAPIHHITATSIVTADGAQFPIDTIIYATGFRTTEFLAPIDVHGAHGIKLQAQWRDGAQAYLGVTVPNFPNLFLMHGPNTILGHNSNIYMIECQARYIVKCLRMLPSNHRGSIEVRPDAMTHYQHQLTKALARTVWTDCHSWYRMQDGLITNPWPGTTMRYRRMLRTPQPASFDVREIPSACLRD
jgi:cation diffusion facilitator CzcD-associated flavoprotein CzcO